MRAAGSSLNKARASTLGTAGGGVTTSGLRTIRGTSGSVAMMGIGLEWHVVVGGLEVIRVLDGGVTVATGRILRPVLLAHVGGVAETLPMPLGIGMIAEMFAYVLPFFSWWMMLSMQPTPSTFSTSKPARSSVVNVRPRQDSRSLRSTAFSCRERV